MTAPAKRPQQRPQQLHSDSALEGKGSGFRIGKELKQLLKESSDLRDLVTAVESALEELQQGGSGGLWPRHKSVEDGYAINPAEDLPGTFFDDVDASADLEVTLPTIAQVDEAGIDRETTILIYRFQNTSGQRFRVTAAAGTTIGIDTLAESADGGHVDLLETGTFLELGLVDDQWRATPAGGELAVDE